MTKSETWARIRTVDPKRFPPDMPDDPWDLSGAPMYHNLFGALNLSNANLQGANLQMSELNGANFDNADLTGAFLRDSFITGATFLNANLSSAKLSGARLDYSNFSGADFRFAEFHGVKMNHANLTKANLEQVVVQGGQWKGVDFSGATFGYTVLASVNLSEAKGLDSVVHNFSSTLGFDTLLKFEEVPSDRFLLGCGMPPRFIEDLRHIFASQKDNKVFLSYTYEGEEHSAWVEKLALALNARGIYVFFDRWDVAPGDSITKFMDRGISEAKIGLFICPPEATQRADEETKWTGYESIQFKVGATKEGKRIIPVLRSGEDVPRYLQSRRWVDMRNNKDFDKGIGEIASFLLGEHRRPPLGKEGLR